MIYKNRVCTEELLTQIHQYHKVVCTSMPGDPLHSGHIACLEESKSHGDFLVVLVDTNEYLLKKKGYWLLPAEERAVIIGNIRFVDCAVITENVAQSIIAIRPHIFTKGGDRTPENLNQEEVEACRSVGCRIICGVGGTDKPVSSSLLFKYAVNKYLEAQHGKV